jgi:hypothetical protein
MKGDAASFWQRKLVSITCWEARNGDCKLFNV